MYSDTNDEIRQLKLEKTYLLDLLNKNHIPYTLPKLQEIYCTKILSISELVVEATSQFKKTSTRKIS